MYYSEDIPEKDEADANEHSIPILDGTARVDYFDQHPDAPQKNKLETLLDYLKKRR